CRDCRGRRTASWHMPTMKKAGTRTAVCRLERDRLDRALGFCGPMVRASGDRARSDHGLSTNVSYFLAGAALAAAGAAAALAPAAGAAALASPAGEAAAPSAAAAGASSSSFLAPAMVAIVKSRLEMTGFTPSGMVTAEM